MDVEKEFCRGFARVVMVMMTCPEREQEYVFSVGVFGLLRSCYTGIIIKD